MRSVFLVVFLLCASCKEPQPAQTEAAKIPESSRFYEFERTLREKAAKQSNQLDAPDDRPLGDEGTPDYRNDNYSPPGERSEVDEVIPDTGGSLATVAEYRDELWSNIVEPQIRVALDEIPNLSKSRPLSVACFATTCQAFGEIYSDIPEFEKAKSFSFIVARRFSQKLGNTNAMVTNVSIDRDAGRFAVEFKRIRVDALQDTQ